MAMAEQNGFQPEAVSSKRRFYRALLEMRHGENAGSALAQNRSDGRTPGRFINITRWWLRRRQACGIDCSSSLLCGVHRPIIYGTVLRMLQCMKVTNCYGVR